MDAILQDYPPLRSYKPHVELTRKYRASHALLCYCAFRFLIEKIMELYKKTGSTDNRLKTTLFNLVDDAKAIKNECANVVGSDEKNKEAMGQIILRIFEECETELKNGKPSKALASRYLECGRLLDIFTVWGALSTDLETKSTFLSILTKIF